LIGFVVEGITDKVVVKEICKKLSIRCSDPKLMRGNKPQDARDLAESLIDEGRKFVLVLKDLKSSEELLKEMEEKIRGVAELIIVRREIES